MIVSEQATTMDVTYYTSDLDQDYYYAALGRVIVAIYLDDKWQDRCIYRPVRKHYRPIPWAGKPLQERDIIMPLEWAYVQANGLELPLTKA